MTCRQVVFPQGDEEALKELKIKFPDHNPSARDVFVRTKRIAGSTSPIYLNPAPYVVFIGEFGRNAMYLEREFAISS